MNGISQEEEFVLEPLAYEMDPLVMFQKIVSFICKILGLKMSRFLDCTALVC